MSSLRHAAQCSLIKHTRGRSVAAHRASAPCRNQLLAAMRRNPLHCCCCCCCCSFDPRVHAVATKSEQTKDYMPVFSSSPAVRFFREFSICSAVSTGPQSGKRERQRKRDQLALNTAVSGDEWKIQTQYGCLSVYLSVCVCVCVL